MQRAREQGRPWHQSLLAAAVGGLLIGVISLAALYFLFFTYTITYRVSGSGRTAQVDYYPGTTLLGGPLSAGQQVALPWELTVRSDSFLHRRIALLQATGDPGETLSCEVLINGALAEANTGAEHAWCSYDEERNPLP